MLQTAEGPIRSPAVLPPDLAAPLADLSSHNILQLCDIAMRQLGEARTLDEVLGIRNQGEAFVTYTRKWRAAFEAQNACRLVVTLAEAKIGAELKAAQERGEVATQSRHPGSVQSSDTAPATLPEIGITRQQASEFKKLAEIGEPAIRQEVERASARGRVVSRSGILGLKAIVKEVVRAAVGPLPEKPTLPSPATAREMARQTGDGVLASDNHYHFAVEPEDERKQQDWYALSEPITALAEIGFTPARGVDAMLPGQAERIRKPLLAAIAWLTEFQERLNGKTS